MKVSFDNYVFSAVAEDWGWEGNPMIIMHSLFPWAGLLQSGPIGVPVTAVSRNLPPPQIHSINALSANHGGGSGDQFLGISSSTDSFIPTYPQRHNFMSSSGRDSDGNAYRNYFHCLGNLHIKDELKTYRRTTWWRLNFYWVYPENDDPYEVKEVITGSDFYSWEIQGDDTTGYSLAYVSESTTSKPGWPADRGWPLTPSLGLRTDMKQEEPDDAAYTVVLASFAMTEEMTTEYLVQVVTQALEHPHAVSLTSPGVGAQVAFRTETNRPGVAQALVAWTDFQTDLLQGPLTVDVFIRKRKALPTIHDRWQGQVGLPYLSGERLQSFPLKQGIVEHILLDEITTDKFADCHGKYDEDDGLDDVGWSGLKPTWSNMPGTPSAPYWHPGGSESAYGYPADPAVHDPALGSIGKSLFLSADGGTYRVTVAAKHWVNGEGVELDTKTVMVELGQPAEVDLEVDMEQAPYSFGEVAKVEKFTGNEWHELADPINTYASEWRPGLNLLMVVKERRGVRWGFPEYDAEQTGSVRRYKRKQVVARYSLESGLPGSEDRAYVDSVFDPYNAYVPNP